MLIFSCSEQINYIYVRLMYFETSSKSFNLTIERLFKDLLTRPKFQVHFFDRPQKIVQSTRSFLIYFRRLFLVLSSIDEVSFIESCIQHPFQFLFIGDCLCGFYSNRIYSSQNSDLQYAGWQGTVLVRHESAFWCLAKTKRAISSCEILLYCRLSYK